MRTARRYIRFIKAAIVPKSVAVKPSKTNEDVVESKAAYTTPPAEEQNSTAAKKPANTATPTENGDPTPLENQLAPTETLPAPTQALIAPV